MKVLFISHDAYRAGAQLLLLGFIQWFKSQTAEEPGILLAGDGELQPQFEALGKVYSWRKYSQVSRRHLPMTWWHNQRILSKLKHQHFDLIYANTAINGELLQALAVLKVPVLTHVHELAFWLNKAGPANWQGVTINTKHYIAAAHAVKNELLIRGLSAEKVRVIYEYTEALGPKQNKSGGLHAKLKLPSEVLLVGACGGEIWRKGKDLFVPLAETTLANYQRQQPVHFVWIGGSLDEQIQQQWEQSAYKAQIHFVSHLPNAATYFNDLAVFAMLSRDDPFPTVNLEAGIRNVPVLAFAESGGSPELLERWPEQIIPFENVEAYAARILYLLNNNQERQLLGLELANHIESHFLIDHIGPQLLQAMRETIEQYES